MAAETAGGGAFTRQLWAEIAPIYDAILAHPFIRGLTDGTLARDSFRYYVVQDALYLQEFARALSLIAAKAPDEAAIVMFNEHAAGAIQVESALHESFFQEFGLSPQEVRATPLAPTNLAYTSYLTAVAYARPVHEVVATVLPCYWIYWEVGKALTRQGSPDALFQRWIATYGADEFGAVVQAVLTLADRLAEPLPAAARQAMARHFVTTSRYEWMFWDMGYREQWPV
jgi:thiaminase (transcriptional activator TenA)